MLALHKIIRLKVKLGFFIALFLLYGSSTESSTDVHQFLKNFFISLLERPSEIEIPLFRALLLFS